jgi:hypothetical protein
LDEAQRGREEEGGVIALVAPRAGGRARAWRATATTGDRTTARQMPPRHVLEGGGFSSRPPSIVSDPCTAMA